MAPSLLDPNVFADMSLTTPSPLAFMTSSTSSNASSPSSTSNGSWPLVPPPHAYALYLYPCLCLLLGVLVAVYVCRVVASRQNRNRAALDAAAWVTAEPPPAAPERPIMHEAYVFGTASNDAHTWRGTLPLSVTISGQIESLEDEKVDRRDATLAGSVLIRMPSRPTTTPSGSPGAETLVDYVWEEELPELLFGTEEVRWLHAKIDDSSKGGVGDVV